MKLSKFEEKLILKYRRENREAWAALIDQAKNALDNDGNSVRHAAYLRTEIKKMRELKRQGADFDANDGAFGWDNG